MGKDVNQYVLSLLETYPETSKRIELMRYELYSSMVVSPQEMIEVMSFSKKDAEANAKYPHTVPEINSNTAFSVKFCWYLILTWESQEKSAVFRAFFRKFMRVSAFCGTLCGIR